MDRREFLIAASFGALELSGGRARDRSGVVSSTPRTSFRPRFMIWTGSDGKASEKELRSRYEAFRRRGGTGVFLSGLDLREIGVIREAGLEAHIWMWTTNRGDKWIRDNHPDWYMVSRTGKSCFDKPPYVDYYRWVSPVIPGVVSYLKEEVDRIASAEGVSGVHLDYVRYPDVILPKDLWKTYGVDQTEELPEWDFCYSDHTRKAFQEKHGRDIREIKQPHNDRDWLQFRYDSVTQLVRELKRVAAARQKTLTAAVFPTPSMARKICRQDWDKWPLDFAAPMMYHSFYQEPVSWLGDTMRENVQAAAFPIVAGLYMPAFRSAEEFREGLSWVKKRGGSGVSLFGGVGEAYWSEFEAAASSWNP